jgi:hypothetical protein
VATKPNKSRKYLYRKPPTCEHDWEWMNRLETHRETLYPENDDAYQADVTYRVKKCRICGIEKFISMWAD